jgi:hypothetical protein
MGQRDAATEEAYARFRHYILARWASMEDYIRVTRLGWAEGRGRNGRRIAVRRLRMRSQALFFEPNRFPYEGAEGAHWILWADRPMSRDLVRKYVEARIGPDVPFHFYVNRRSKQSVPGVWHAHVFMGASV